MRCSFEIILTLFLASLAISQAVGLSGRVIGRKNSPLTGANIRLVSRSDSTDHHATSTDSIGHFVIEGVHATSYWLEVSYLGYETIVKVIEPRPPKLELGTIVMSEQAIPMNEVVVEARTPAAVQKSDTTEYNAAAFKVSKDATAEDLVTKMPGVTIENGTVKAQGENVQQVLVDGRPFFGNDATLSLRNLPSEIIDKVQVFDKLSDQAQLTGFDDGQSIKTMNIVTRPDRRRGQFGKLSGGYGTDDRYTAGGNLNSFQADQRMSVIGLSNNINQQNFSAQDILGITSSGGQRGGFGGAGGGGFGGPRRGGGGNGGGGQRTGGGQGNASNASNFLIGQQSGITSANSLGLNYTDSLWHQFSVNGSYFFNLTNNENPQSLRRQYLISADSSSFYGETSDADRKNYNNRLNFRIEDGIDSSNSLIFTPQIYFQNNSTTSSLTGSSLSSGGTLLSESQNENVTSTKGYTMQGHLVYRHKFPTQGRTVSVDIGAGSNQKTSTNNLSSLATYYNSQQTLNDTINQQSNVLSNGTTLSSNLVYTEPVWGSGLLQLNYSPSYSKSTSDNKTYDYNIPSGEYSDLNTRLSNNYENTYVTNSAGLGYRFRAGSFNSTAGVSYQIARLDGEESYPRALTTSKTFYSFLPNAMLNLELSSRQNLRVAYRTSTQSPTIAQLQSVVDNTNPLLLSVGNPNLKQSFNQTLLTRLSLANPSSAQSLLLFIYLNAATDYIGNASIIPQHDTLLAGGVQVNQGTQLTLPVNLDGSNGLRSLITYGLPVDFIKSNLNANLGFTYTRTPGLVNGLDNMSGVAVFSPGFVLGSNISTDLDFTISYTANFNNSKNSVQSELNDHYFYHTAGFKLNWIFWNGFVLKNDMTSTLYRGLSEGLNQDYLLWNISIGRKFFDDQRGELLLGVYDLLDQNKSINRTVTETYTEDTTTKVLNRYVMLTFTYTLRQYHDPNSDQ